MLVAPDGVDAREKALRARLSESVRLQWQKVPAFDALELLLVEPGTSLQDPETIQDWMQAPPYWTVLWAAGLALGQYLLNRPHLVQGKTVVDLGCGCGAVAILADRLGAKEVWAVDTDPAALQAALCNAARVGASIKCCDSYSALPLVPDLILASDFLYDAENDAVLRWMLDGNSALLLAESRRPASLHGLPRLCSMQADTFPIGNESSAYTSVYIHGRET